MHLCQRVKPAKIGEWIGYRITGCLLIPLLGCGAPTSTKHSILQQRSNAAAVQQAVALVNGQAVGDRQACARLPTVAQRQACSDQAIEEALLAEEAERRGMAQRPAFQRAWRRVLAAKMLASRYVDHFTPKDIPRNLVERAYELNTRYYNRPESLEVDHILVMSSPKDTKETRQKARSLAEKIHHEATLKPLSVSEFTALGKRIEVTAAPLRMRIESFSMVKGETVPEFEQVAFAMQRPGEISAVTATDFGFHVIYFRGRKAGTSRPLASVEAELRQKIFNESRRYLLDTWLKELRKQADVHVDEQALRVAFSGGSSS